MNYDRHILQHLSPWSQFQTHVDYLSLSTRKCYSIMIVLNSPIFLTPNHHYSLRTIPTFPFVVYTAQSEAKRIVTKLDLQVHQRL